MTIAAVAAFGCSTLIGLEDRNLRADGGGAGIDGGSAGGEGGAGDGGDIDAGGEDDAGNDGSLIGPGDPPCTLVGSAVLEFRAGDESWRYDISPTPTNDGFNFTGIPFHLVRSTEMQLTQAKRQLYMKREKGTLQGDHFATITQNELPMTYDTIATMFAVYDLAPPAVAPPGTVEIKVIVRDVPPVRHKLLVGKNAVIPIGWKHDNRTFYACP